MGNPGDHIKVDYNVVNNLADDLVRAIDHCQNYLDEFIAVMNNNRQNFVGDAAEEFFDRKMAQWQQSVQDLKTLGKYSAQELINSAVNYNETDKKAAARFADLNTGY